RWRAWMANLPEIIREHSDRVVARWLERVRGLEAAVGLSDDELVDSLPMYLATLLSGREDGPGGIDEQLKELSVAHVGVRLRQGFLVDDVVTEYAFLGRVVLEVWLQYERPDPAALDWLFDKLEIAQSLVRKVFTTH